LAFSTYHGGVAVRKGRTPPGTGKTGPKSSRKPPKKRKLSLSILFWLAFFIVVAGLFFVNREVIRRTLRNTQVFSGASNRTAPEDAPAPSVTVSPAAGDRGGETQLPVETPSRPARPADDPAAAPAPAEPVPARPAETTKPPPAAAAKPPAAAESRERALYFTRVDKDGAILRTKVTRKLPLSDSPMVDALKMLIQGPNTEEQRQGLVTLIPQGTRILAARVQGNTAYISFSEEFQYNTYGVEGYAAQLRQIVWTATEFPGVKDIQILIEGRRVDYLGEGIWIGSPVDRNTL
jgi:spore germination protein GerM